MLHVITGPPCAGKTTYVGQHARDGDVRIDLDAIASALGAESGHQASGDVLKVALAARKAAIEASRDVNSDTWLIHTAPNDEAFGEYESSGAELVVLDPGKETCLERAHDRPPGTKEAIEGFYENLESTAYGRFFHAHKGDTQRLRPKALEHPGKTGDKEPEMAEQKPTDPKPQGEGEGAKPAEPKTFTQEQVEQMIQERVKRVKSSVPDDYEDLKAKAAKLDEMEDKGADELEKLTKKLQALEDDNRAMKHAAEVSAWRKQAAEEAGVPADILRGDTLEELQAHAEAVKEALPKYPSVDPGKPATGKMTKAEILAIENPKERKAAMLEHIDLF